MSRKKKTRERSFLENTLGYQNTFNDLLSIAMSRFEYENVPEGIDLRYLEESLINYGSCLLFRDEGLEKFLGLRSTNNGFDVYNNPTRFEVNTSNGYHAVRDNSNAVLMYSNVLRIPDIRIVRHYAHKIANCDRTIDVNVNAQKTPVLILCPESQILSMIQLYESYEGNEPVIMGDKETLSKSEITALKTDAPYVADKIYSLKTQYINEFLTVMGIPNISFQKKERMIMDEVNRSQGGTLAHRISPLETRERALKRFNEIFGTEMTVKFSEDFTGVSKAEADIIRDIDGEPDTLPGGEGE